MTGRLIPVRYVFYFILILAALEFGSFFAIKYGFELYRAMHPASQNNLSSGQLSEQNSIALVSVSYHNGKLILAKAPPDYGQPVKFTILDDVDGTVLPDPNCPTEITSLVECTPMAGSGLNIGPFHVILQGDIEAAVDIAP